MTADAQTISRIHRIFIDVFEIDSALLKPESHVFADLGLDSLDAIDIAISIEKEFGIRVPKEDVATVRKLSDVYAIVDKNLAMA